MHTETCHQGFHCEYIPKIYLVPFQVSGQIFARHKKIIAVYLSSHLRIEHIFWTH